MEIKESVLRDQAALSGHQLVLMAAEHRLSLALIWMSTRRLVLCLPACLCAATVRCVPVNSIKSVAATSSHAKVINKHPQMAHNVSDAAVSGPVAAAHSSVCLTVDTADTSRLLLWHHFSSLFKEPLWLL